MVNWTNVFELTFWGCISIGIWEIAKDISHKKKAMEIKNIKTSYGEFPTIIHYENYWKKKVKEAEGKQLPKKVVRR